MFARPAAGAGRGGSAERQAPQRRQLGRHGDLKNHNYHAGRTDKPIAGLLKDLKRGLLDETLAIWGGEFGRQPTAEYAEGTGRDHNAYGFTMDGRRRHQGRRASARPTSWARPP